MTEAHWTEEADLNTARFSGGSAGTQTAALYFGGRPPPSDKNETESWNGSAWTEVINLNNARGERLVKELMEHKLLRYGRRRILLIQEKLTLKHGTDRLGLKFQNLIQEGRSMDVCGIRFLWHLLVYKLVGIQQLTLRLQKNGMALAWTEVGDLNHC